MSEHSSPGNGLLPCPFCGAGETHVGVGSSQDMVDGEYIEEGRQWSVICGKCGSSCSLYCVSEQAAIEAWNTRVPAQGVTEPTPEMIDAAAREIWNDRDARHGGPWEGRNEKEICVIQTKATARAALIAALSVSSTERS